MKAGIFSFVLLSSLLMTCVDPFDADTEKKNTRIVVEGGITDQPPPYSVTLTKSSNYSRDLDGLVRFVSGASVRVCNNKGLCIPFFEVEKGRYETAVNAPRGKPGEIYHIEVTLPGDKRIFSHPEKLIVPPPVDTAYYEYDVSTVERDGFQVYIDTRDPAGERNFYKWETVNYYPYSYFCFNVEKEKPIQAIADDKNRDGNLISRIPVKTVPLSGTLYWVVHIIQFALSENAYQYFDQIKKQLDATGSIFDPPPGFIRGNCYNPDNEDEIVLGYFMVAGSSSIEIAVNRSVGVTPFPSTTLTQDPVYCGNPCDLLCVAFAGGECGNRPCPPDCASLPGKTNIAPAAWPLPHAECGP